MKGELPIIQKTYDLIKWYVPILNRLPRDHKLLLGERMISGLYDLLENLVTARYEQDKLPRLKGLNGRLDILRYQTRLLLELELLSERRYEYVGQMINAVGVELGGWIRQQAGKGAKGDRGTAEAQRAQRNLMGERNLAPVNNSAYSASLR